MILTKHTYETHSKIIGELPGQNLKANRMGAAAEENGHRHKEDLHIIACNRNEICRAGKVQGKPELAGRPVYLFAQGKHAKGQDQAEREKHKAKRYGSEYNK